MWTNQSGPSQRFLCLFLLELLQLVDLEVSEQRYLPYTGSKITEKTERGFRLGRLGPWIQPCLKLLLPMVLSIMSQ